MTSLLTFGHALFSSGKDSFQQHILRQNGFLSCSYYKLCQTQETLPLLFHYFDHNTSTCVTLGACNVVLAFLSLYSPLGEGVPVNFALSWIPIELRWLPHFWEYLDICQGLAPVLEVISFLSTSLNCTKYLNHTPKKSKQDFYFCCFHECNRKFLTERRILLIILKKE